MKRVRLVCIFIAVLGGLFGAGLWLSEMKQAAADHLVVPTRSELTVYTDGDPDLMMAIGRAYEKEAQVKVHMIPIGQKQMGTRLALPEGEQQGDLVISTVPNLGQGVTHGAFHRLPADITQNVEATFHGTNEQWVGIWYDPYVFAVHNDFYNAKGKYVNTWFSLAYTGPWRIAVTDFVADERAITLLNTFGGIYGQEGAISYFDSLRPHIVQYTKELPSPVRMAAIGDVDIGVGRYSDAKLYEVHKYPLTILYPREGTPYDMMGVAILKGTTNESESKAFITWLLSERLQAIWKDNDVHYIATINTMASHKDRQGNPLVLWTGGIAQAEETKLLREWIRQVRFRKDTP